MADTRPNWSAGMLCLANRYRREAERLRELASAAAYVWVRDAFSEIAQQYDHLAEEVEEHHRRGSRLDRTQWA